MKLSELQTYLLDYLQFDKNLDCRKIDPYMTNGLMVKGKDEVEKIGFSVSASIALFEKAKAAGCDALIVHHSFNFPSANYYDAIFQKRIEYLIRNGISLFGYHFLLDAHPEVGNNAMILKTIGAVPTHPYIFHGSPWGWTGTIEGGRDRSSIIETLKPHLNNQPVIYQFGPENIKKVVAVSGKGPPGPSDFHHLKEKGIDLYITGEVHEWVMELSREAGINFISGGHYCTEKFGVQALMKKLQSTYPQLKTEWLEVYNEI